MKFEFLEINGINTLNIFSFENNSFSVSGEKTYITPRTISNGVAYDAIIIPCSYKNDDKIKVTFKLNKFGETFTWTMPDTNFISGNQYIYTVSITRKGVNVIGEIADWNSNYMDGVYFVD